MLTLPRTLTYLLEDLEELIAASLTSVCCMNPAQKSDYWRKNDSERQDAAEHRLRQARRKLEELADELRRP